MRKFLHRYNWHPSLPDKRDIVYQVERISIKKEVDLRALCSSVDDQGDEGSCTANAGIGAMEYLELLAMRQTAPANLIFDKEFKKLSRQFLYFNELWMDGNNGKDVGSTGRTCVKALAKYGACEEATWNYGNNLQHHPVGQCYVEAAQHRVSVYQSLRNIGQMKSCLSAGYPFIFGFTVYESFESDAVATTGMVPMPNHSESVLGGHMVMAVGYSDAKKYFVIRNSWGQKWGDGGYCYMPYSYISDNDYTDDFWTIRR